MEQTIPNLFCHIRKRTSRIMEIMEITVVVRSILPPHRPLHCLVRDTFGVVWCGLVWFGVVWYRVRNNDNPPQCPSASWFLSHPKAKLSRKLEFNNK